MTNVKKLKQALLKLKNYPQCFHESNVLTVFDYNLLFLLFVYIIVKPSNCDLDAEKINNLIFQKKFNRFYIKFVKYLYYVVK